MCNNIPIEKKLLQDPHGNSHQLILEKSLEIVAWRISENTWKSKEYQKRFQSSWLVHEDRAHFLIITRPAESDLVDPIIRSINYVLDIVAYLYGMELEYFTVNPQRSSISAYHFYVENSPVGKHPGVSGLMTGVFNVNPPKPKYVFIWDLQKVLSYFNNLPIHEELLDLW